MKAAVLHNFGEKLSVEQVSDLVIGTGEVLVDVVAAPVLSYTKQPLTNFILFANRLSSRTISDRIGRITKRNADCSGLICIYDTRNSRTEVVRNAIGVAIFVLPASLSTANLLAGRACIISSYSPKPHSEILR